VEKGGAGRTLQIDEIAPEIKKICASPIYRDELAHQALKLKESSTGAADRTFSCLINN
jgi:acyl-CoA hydrolase